MVEERKVEIPPGRLESPWEKEILASLQANPPADKVQRLRKAAKETQDAFYNRVVQALLEGRLSAPKPKKPEQDPLHKITPRSIEALQDVFGLTEEDVRQCCEPPVINFPSDILAIRASAEAKIDVLDSGGLRPLREAMHRWTTEAYWEHAEEASCNLRCLECPSAMVLGCATDNLTSSLSDGFEGVRDIIMSM